jgi:toxin ParE1/3/4
MSRPLIITSEAEDDIAEAKAWYNRRRRGLGDEFVLMVETALDRIRGIPEGATEIFPGVRRVVPRRFPYGVFYRVDPDQIGVIAVYHSKRDPRGWQERS